MEKDSLSIYLEEINKIPLLTPEQEQELVKKAVAGSKVAKNKLVEANLRFVVKIAKEYMNRGIEFEDLINEGNAGLMQAINHFDANAGVKFISYAVWWIRQSIMKALYEHGHEIRLPMNRANELVNIEKARKLVADKPENIQVEEISAMLGMNKDVVKNLMDVSREMKSLDSPISNGDATSDSIGDMISDTRYKNPETEAIENSLKEDVEEALSKLSPKEAKILRLRFGFGGEDSMSLKEVGDKIGLTKERIRQIEKHAISTIKLPSRMKKLSAYVA
ncbi:MAG: RNA polymerase sigma factor RpoD/SigA [Treponema sp.]|nr:RNA polymerase sigma factor RpoD/SigA [Treponema sp.]MBR6912902.1 RNA polymerase sigma factor RpoD/SigA [Treponema sp.]